MKLLELVLTFSLLFSGFCLINAADTGDDAVAERERLERRTQTLQFAVQNGPLLNRVIKTLPIHHQALIWSTFAAGSEIYGVLREENLREKRGCFRLQDNHTFNSLTTGRLKLDTVALMRAEKERKHQLMQQAVRQKNDTNDIKKITVQIVDNKLKQGASHTISLADLMQRQQLVYGPGAEKDRVKTAHNFEVTVEVSGDQIASVGDSSYLVGVSPKITVNQDGTITMLYPDQPALLVGTELQLGDERLTLQEMPASTMPRLF